MQTKLFIKKYAEEVVKGTAAVFAGAGLSVPSGFVSWKDLLQPFAEEIGLSMEKENDYLSIAQYYVNSKRNRTEINRRICSAFISGAKENQAVDIITRLPISTYWTTNYDHLIEESLQNNGKVADVKINPSDFLLEVKGAAATVYKMHGDIQFPEHAVLTKRDYEDYDLKKAVFKTVLKSDLLSKTFLFIGFSFDDPNLNRILASMRALVGEDMKPHYCFFKAVTKEIEESEEDFKYRKTKQDLMVEDLKNYGIDVVLLSDYEEIPKILREVEKLVNLKNIFLSGSFSVETNEWKKEQVTEFTKTLAKLLVEKEIKITSGYGLGVGSATITGVLEEVRTKKHAHFDDYLKLYPFPQPKGFEDYRELWHVYRTEMMLNCGTAIFIFGNKESDGKKVLAEGVRDEYKIAKEKGLILIPVASTGEMASTIYDEMFSNKDLYPYLSEYWDALKNERDPIKIVELVNEIINKRLEQIGGYYGA